MNFDPVVLNEIGVFGLYIVFGYLVGEIIERAQAAPEVEEVPGVDSRDSTTRAMDILDYWTQRSLDAYWKELTKEAREANFTGTATETAETAETAETEEYTPLN